MEVNKEEMKKKINEECAAKSREVDGQKQPEFRVGDRVFVIHTDFASFTRLQKECGLEFTDIMKTCSGRIGMVEKVNGNGGVVDISFYIYAPPVNVLPVRQSCVLSRVVCKWNVRAVRKLNLFHASTGDKVAWIKGYNTSRPVMASIEVIKLRDETYRMVVAKKKFSFKKDLFPNDVILPIYNGHKMMSVVREKEALSTHSDFQAVDRLIFGPSAKNLVMQAMNDDYYSLGLLRAALIKFPDLRNKPIGQSNPLVLAVKHGSWPAVEILLAAGAPKNARDDDGNGIFHTAVISDRTDMLEKLIQRAPREINQRNAVGQTALHLSVILMKPAFFYRLICAEFCDPNFQDRDGNSLFHMIIGIQDDLIRIPMLNRLISNLNFNLTLRNKEGFSATDVAVINGAETALDILNRTRPQLLLSGNSRGLTPLHIAAKHGNARILELILSNERCEVGRCTSDGITALHNSISQWGNDMKADTDRMTCIQLLISHNINVNARCRVTGDTACHILMRQLMRKGPIPEDIVTAIVNGGMNVNRFDKLAQLCRPHWELATLCYLCLKGADLTAENKEGETILSMWDNPDIHNICREMAKNLRRGFVQITRLKDSATFDSSLLAMCTFNCDNSAANVRFVPCGHKSICSSCVADGCFIPYQCPICFQKIIRLKSDEGENWDCDALRDSSLAAIAERKKEEEVDSSVVDVGGQVDRVEESEIDIEKRNMLGAELQELEMELEELEEQITCPICMDEWSNIVFCCGHACCSGCGGKKMLKDSCPICRQPIAHKYEFSIEGN